MADAATKPAKPRKPRRTGDTPRAKVGRHHELDAIVTTRNDGHAVTVEEAILERIRTAMPVVAAAGSVGIKNATFYDWRRKGVRVRKRMLAGEQITDADELRYMQFADKVDQAEMEALATEWTRHGLAAAGGQPIERTIVTRTVKPGENGATEVVSTRTETERAQPSTKALEWRMKVRFPDLIQERTVLTGVDGGPVEVDVLDVRAAALAGRFDRFVEASGVEVMDSREAGTPGPSTIGAGVGVGEVAASLPRGSLAASEMDVPSPDVDVPAPRD